MKILRVKDWNERFESAKSRTYKIKSQTYMPNKQGLGYTRLMKRPDGAAIYGAWCALVNLLSRQESPRHGYLTDSGRTSGYPWTADDIANLTMIPAKIVSSMLKILSSHEIGWLQVATVADTTVSLEGIPPRIPDGPSPSPSPSPLPLPLPNKKKAFEPPSVADVAAYAASVSFSSLDAEAFVAFYESKGWRVGNTPMRSWKSAVITWKKRAHPSDDKPNPLFAGAL